MVRYSAPRPPLFALLSALVFFSAACGSGVRTATPSITPNTPPAAQANAAARPPAIPAVPPEDPVVTLIASSDRHFKAGQQELELGHVGRAKQEFDEAITVLIESPYDPDNKDLKA